jgi:hypothetical protein
MRAIPAFWDALPWHRHRVRHLAFVDLRPNHRRYHMPTIVTSIVLAPGGAKPVEIGVQDQSGNAIMPGDITWVLSASPVAVSALQFVTLPWAYKLVRGF